MTAVKVNLECKLYYSQRALFILSRQLVKFPFAVHRLLFMASLFIYSDS